MNPIDFRIRNSRKIFAAAIAKPIARLANAAGILTMQGLLTAHWIRGDYRKAPKIVDLGVLGHRSVTDAGVAFLATDFFDGSTDCTVFDFHDAGTGVGAEAVGNTTLGTPWGGARVSGTASNPAGGQYRTIGTITFNANFAITEHGLFSASSGGTLWDRTVFSAINVANTDAIQFTYTLTINSGG
jgi:hypothetical protein